MTNRLKTYKINPSKINVNLCIKKKSKKGKNILIASINIKYKLMNDKVDILLTTYNSNIIYLKEQITSILEQTYYNISLLISDDASTKKDIQKVLKEYEKKDKRIKIFFQETNLGYNKNFEFLLKQSTAKYIMFSDHDDIWYKEKVEKSLEKIKKENVDLVYSNAKQIDENGNILHNNYFKYKNVPLIKGKNNCLAISRCIGIGCSQIITKNVKDKMIPFTKEVIAHDWLASFIANEANGIDYIEEPLFDYRLHDSNVFGGRSLSQNLNIWKEKNGVNYKSYLKYRNKRVIDIAYLDGAKMCLQYAKIEEDKKYIKSLIEYYKQLKKSRYLNFCIGKYNKFLSGKNLLKKEIKEILIFHFPLIGYIKFRIG